MSFLPTAFLSFFGDERERERLKKACPFLRERGGVFKEGGEEVQESCGKAWHGLEELRGYIYTLHIIAFSSSTSMLPCILHCLS